MKTFNQRTTKQPKKSSVKTCAKKNSPIEWMQLIINLLKGKKLTFKHSENQSLIDARDLAMLRKAQKEIEKSQALRNEIDERLKRKYQVGK